MDAHCRDCDSTFLITPDGMTQAAACPHCGGTRLERDQPSPTRSDGELRNTVNQGTDPALGLDQGGNPLQEGIWGQVDGGWQPHRRRDESFASVKEAGGYRLPGEEFVEDDSNGFANRMKIRHQLRQNESPRGHQLEWTPGMHGRGLFVGPYLHTWNAYDPNTVHQQENPDMGVMHGDYINGLGIDPSLVDASTGVEIRPDGTVEALSGRNTADYARVDPRLKAGGEQQWSFGSMSLESRSLNMEPYMPWTHVAEAVPVAPAAPQHVATVTPGPHGIHNGTIRWLSFLDAHVNGKSAREHHNELFQRHGMRNSPEFGQPVQVAVHHPEHLPGAIETIETSADYKAPPALKDVAAKIASGHVPPPPGIDPTTIRFSKTAGPLAALGLAGIGGEGLIGGLMTRALGGIGANAVGGMFGGGGGQQQPGPQSTPPPRSVEQLSHVTADIETPHTNPRFVETEDGDTHEFEDESTDPAFQNPNVDAEAGGAAQGEDNVDGGIGAKQPGFSPGTLETVELLLPKILDYAHSDKSGQEDPQIKALHEQLEKEFPGYLEKGDDAAVDGYIQGLREPSAVSAKTSFDWNQSLGPGQALCAHCGGQTTPDGRCAQCGAQNNPNPNAQQGGGLGPGFNPQTTPGAVPQAIPHPGYVGKVAANHQGPATDEQKAAVAQLLLDTGREQEIPTMFTEPWQFAKEMAEVANRPNVVPAVDPNQQPPAPPVQEVAPPGATMPVPNPADPTQGGQMISKVAAPDDPNVVGVPAADQVGPRDVEQEQDSSHTWQTPDGQPLQVGQTYEMASPKYSIPDIVKVVAVKPDALEVETIGEYTTDPNAGTGLNYKHEITREEVQLEGITFNPSSSQDSSPEDQQEDPDGSIEPAESPTQESPNVQPLSSVETPDEDHCPRCSNLHISSEMSSPTTVFHECFKCGHGWETKEQDYLDHNTASREWINTDSGPADDFDFDKVGKMGGSARNLAEIAERDTRGQQIKAALDTAAEERMKIAGKHYTPREQREFIDEQGVARNADKLDLEGTHYKSHRYLGDKANGMNVDDSHLFLGL